MMILIDVLSVKFPLSFGRQRKFQSDVRIIYVYIYLFLQIFHIIVSSCLMMMKSTKILPKRRKNEEHKLMFI